MLNYDPTELCLKGERYPTRAPDTLYLADRMGLALNALTISFVSRFAKSPAITT